MFDDLGVVDRVIAHGRMAMPIRLTGLDGQVTLGGAETTRDRPDIPYPASLITPQWRVEEALRLRPRGQRALPLRGAGLGRARGRAARAHLSRSAFSDRFAAMVGEPPMTYALNWWMAVA